MRGLVACEADQPIPFQELPCAENTRPQAPYALRECIRRQLDSGLTIAQFCVREHLSVATFQSWKHRLRLIDLAERHPAVAAPPAFLPVTVHVPEYVLISTRSVSQPAEFGAKAARRKVKLTDISRLGNDRWK